MRFIKNTRHWFARLFRTTPAEIYVAAVVGGLALGVGSYTNESYREDKVPVAVTGKGQVIQDIEKQTGKDLTDEEALDPCELYTHDANNVPMKIVEDWNEAHETFWGDPIERFAEILKERWFDSDKFHDSLPELLKKLPDRAQACLDTDDMQRYAKANHLMMQAAAHLDASWKYRYYEDTYQTCTESCSSTYDSDNNYSGEDCTEICTTHCNYEEHEHWFNRGEAKAAAKLLKQAAAELPNLSLHQRFREPSTTHKLALEVAEKSGALENCDKKLSLDDCINQVLNSWKYGSTMYVNQTPIEMNWHHVIGEARNSNIAPQTAKDHYFVRDHTCMQGPNHPTGFNLTRKISKDSKQVAMLTAETLNAIQYVKQNAPKLYDQIEKFIGSPIFSTDAEAKQQAEAIMGTSKKMYISNFKEGQDFERFRKWHVVMWTVIGTVLGGLVGAGLDYVGNQRGWYDHARPSAYMNRRRKTKNNYRF